MCDKLNTIVNSLGKEIPDATFLIHINQYNKNKQSLGKKIDMLIKNDWPYSFSNYYCS